MMTKRIGHERARAARLPRMDGFPFAMDSLALRGSPEDFQSLYEALDRCLSLIRRMSKGTAGTIGRG
jgi:hypothetical protein